MICQLQCPWWWIGPVLHTKSCILHIICNILYVAKYYMTQRWLWYKFLKHKTLHIVKTYCSLDKIKNHKSSHFSCFKRSIFSFPIIIISSASIETKWSKVHWSVHWSFWASYPKFPRLKFRISFTHEWDLEPDRQDSFGQKGQGVH